MSRPRAAVVGSGVSGLTAAHVLQADFDVTVFEADPRPGGHADTHEVVTPDAGDVPVDTGFIVHNRVTYPNLLRLFAELGVATEPTGMSMSVRCEGCGLEYAGALGLRGVFARRRSAADPAFLRMLVEVARFHRSARRLLAADEPVAPEGAAERTLGEFLRAGRFSRYFTAHFVVPVVSAVWSAAPGTALEYPARYLFRFLANHGMLSVKGSHQWYTVEGGSRTYVEAVSERVSALRLSTPVVSLGRAGRAGGGRGAVRLRTADGGEEVFDAAVVATHPPDALALLEEPTPLERELLGAFEYARNPALLHSDVGLLPRAPRARAAWNYLLDGCSAEAGRAVVSYDMNRLQHLGTARPLIVTLNGDDRVDQTLVAARMDYEHPVYTTRSVRAQARIGELNRGNVAFAGAYHGWGFHEDGCRSGVAAAAHLGVRW